MVVKRTSAEVSWLLVLTTLAKPAVVGTGHMA